MFSFRAAAFRSRCGKVKVQHESGLYSRIAGMEVEAPSWSVGRTQLSSPPLKPPTHSSLPQISPWTPERSVCSGIIIVRLCFTPYTNTRLCQSSGKLTKTDVVDSELSSELIHLLFLPLNCYILRNLNITLLILYKRFCFFLLFCWIHLLCLQPTYQPSFWYFKLFLYIKVTKWQPKNL